MARRSCYFVTCLIFAWLVLLGGCSIDSEDTNRSNSAASDPFEQCEKLGRAVNLGNALEAPHEGAWGLTLKEEYFELIKEAGFESVRIPIRWSAHASSDSPFTMDPSLFERVDWAVKQALSRALSAVINVHHYDEIMTNPDQHRERFLGLWGQIAHHYKDYSDSLYFEILNEPHDNLTPDLWNQFLAEAIKVVRKTNPRRTIVVGTASWGGIGSLNRLLIPSEEQNIIVTFHYYSPFEFTHQGAEWVSGSEAWLGTSWHGTTGEEQAVDQDLDQAVAWAEDNERPLYLGEFGAYSKADLNSRVRWTSYVARQAEIRRISWAYWEFGAGFGVYNRDQQDWNYSILEALIPPE